MLETIATRYEGIYLGTDTALLGRANYVGFAGVWPGMTRDPASDARTRDVGEWLEQVDEDRLLPHPGGSGCDLAQHSHRR